MALASTAVVYCAHRHTEISGGSVDLDRPGGPVTIALLFLLYDEPTRILPVPGFPEPRATGVFR
jgi:hypothetical protein